jgi:hypothetical protein
VQVGQEFKPKKKVIAIDGGLRAVDENFGNIALRVSGEKIFAGEQDQHIRSEVDPPVGRLDFGHERSIGIGGSLGEKKRRPSQADDRESQQSAEKRE